MRGRPAAARAGADLRQERAQAHRLEDLLGDLHLALAGRAGLRRERDPDRVADALVEQDRQPGGRGDDALVPHPGLGQAQVERVVAARREQPVDVDQVADAGDLGADDDPVVAHARSASASSAERSADSSIASIITSRASRGSASAALASISSVRIAWSSDPQLTPMRTGLSLSIATRTIVAKCSSWRLAPDVAGVDPVLGERRGHLRVVDQELVAVVVEVADDRHVDAEAADLADHLGDGGGGLLGVDRDPDELRAGVRQPRDLDRGPVGVGGVGVRHRLDDDRVGAPDEDAADVHADRRAGGAAGAASGEVTSRRRRRLRTMSKPVTQMRNANRNTNPTM